MPHLGKTSYFLLSCAYLICFLIESCCTNQFGKSTKRKQLNLSYIWCYEPSYRVFPILQLHRFESGACILCLLMLVSFNTLKTSYFIGCLAEFGLNFYVGIIHIGCLYIKGHLEAVRFVWEAWKYYRLFNRLHDLSNTSFSLFSIVFECSCFWTLAIEFLRHWWIGGHMMCLSRARHFNASRQELVAKGGKCLGRSKWAKWCS